MTWTRFVFGGIDKIKDVSYDDAWVLTLPGFHWTRITSPNGSGQRTFHQCIVVGNRQMLSIGGEDETKRDQRDPWPNGMGILDMTELKWTTEYKPDAAKYEQPRLIQDWYAGGGNMKAVVWSSETVKRLFVDEDGSSVGGSGNTPGMFKTLRERERLRL